MSRREKSANFFNTACLFEAALGLVAVLLAWLLNINPFAQYFFSESALAYGILGTIPLFLLFLGLEKSSNASLAEIRRFLINTLGPSLHRYHWTDLLILSAIAGIGEELLFRGVLQTWLESSLSVPMSLLISSVVFGLAHAITPLYAVLASLVGLYLGISLDISGERNLLIPMIIHGFYDFLAFISLLHSYRLGLAKTEDMP